MKQSISSRTLAMFLLMNTCALSFLSPDVATQSQKSNAPPVAFAELRDSLTAKILSFEPEELRMLGDRTVIGRLKDWSPRAIKAEIDFCQGALLRLESVQASKPAEKLDKQILEAHLTYLAYYYGQYHGELGNLQISAYPYDLIQYELQRFATGNRDQASALEHFNGVEGILAKLPDHLVQQESNLIAGLKLRQPDKEILRAMIKRIGSPNDRDSIRGGLKAIIGDLESTTLESLLSSSKRENLRGLIQLADVAYARHANVLTIKILPQAHDSWALGKDEYERRFALVYGNSVSIDDLVREAEIELRRINREMLSLARELRPNLSLMETLEELRNEHPATEQQLLSAYEQVQKRIDDGLTRRLGLPAGSARYVSAPPGVPVSPATNWPAPLFSRGLGIVLVNTSSAGLVDNSTVDLAWIANHEGNPGHAAQSLLFQRAFNDGSAPLCRFLNVPDEVGYVRGNWYSMANIEGWAFYTERLLITSGILTREERLAALTGQALRAARVVVDVRMHSQGWSRRDAADYLTREAALSPEAARSQAYRYSRIPLQALSYYFGARSFEELHRKHASRFGDDFYRQVLMLGPVPPKSIDTFLESSSQYKK